MSVGLYSHTTRATGTVLTAAIYNSDHQNHITNQNPSATGAFSDTVGQMQTVTDPGGVGSESLAPHLAGELERLRFAIKRILGEAQWYSAPAQSIFGLNQSAFPSGTKMLFVQTAAPSGWTKDVTHNDKALRVVTGAASSGGTSAFSTIFASRTPTGTVGNTILDVTQIPSHLHFVIADEAGAGGSGGSAGLIAAGEQLAASWNFGNSNNYSLEGTTTAATVGESSNTGGGGSHTHSFTGTAMDFAVQFVDVIIATKN